MQRGDKAAAQAIVENLPAEVVANASQILRTAHSLGLDERVKEIASVREDASAASPPTAVNDNQPPVAANDPANPGTSAGVADVWTPTGVDGNASKVPVGRAMIAQLEQAGVPEDKALKIANQYLQSGSTLPVAQPLKAGDALVKIVPAGSTPSDVTGYWTTMEGLQAELQKPELLTQRLGLPPSSANASSFDIFQIRAQEPVTVFQSTIAPTVNSATGETQSGGALQTLVMNRKRFTPPEKIGSFNVP